MAMRRTPFVTRTLYSPPRRTPNATTTIRLGSGRDVPEFIGTQRFQVQRRLGAGGFGVVYEAFDRERNTRVALKTLARLEPSALYRFKREFRALADVSHENLVELHELVSVGEQWFFTMELIAGVDFLSWCWGRVPLPLSVSPFTATIAADAPLSRSGERPISDHDRDRGAQCLEHPMPLPRVDYDRLRAALRQLARGVAGLHAMGILHRDIKPSNILVSGAGRVVLVDFGIAAELHRPDAMEVGISGTPAYMAPEQGAGVPLDEAADWYGVGVVLYETLTGTLPFVGGLMQMLADKQYKTPRRARELAPDTPEDLDQLCMALLRTHPSERPIGAEVIERLERGAPSGPEITVGERISQNRISAPSISMPFVGRRDALSTLSEAFRTAQSGRAVSVFVHGRSGMGKSALVQHFFDVITQSESKREALGGEWLDTDLRRDAVVLAGRCYERESMPYKAFDSLIDALTHFLISSPRDEVAAWMPRDATVLARVFPVLRRVAAIAEAKARPREVVDPQQLRTRAFGALRELLTRIADRRPLVVFIDDLQWGDADSAALLAGLTAPPDPPALLLILGYRDEEAATSPMLKALSGQHREKHALGASIPPPSMEAAVHTIALDALDGDEAKNLALQLLGDEAATHHRLAEGIARESGGSPFFIGELVRYVQATNLRASAAGVRLETVLRDRLLALPEGALRVLEIVSIGGGPVPINVAFRAAELTHEARTQALGILRVGHLVRVGGTRAADRIEPFHDRIRETVVSTLDADRARELHRALALALTEAGDADPETLFLHFRAAGIDDRAAEHAEAAASKAARALAFERASQFYRHAIELLPPDSPRVQPLRVMLGDALANAGRGPEAAEAYIAATPQANADQQLDLRRRAAEQLLCTGHIDQGLDIIQAVLARVGMRLASSPARAVLALLLYRFWLYLRGLSFTESDATAVAATELSRIDVCWSTSVGLALADMVRAAQFSSRNLTLALAAGEPSRLCRALALEAGFIGTLGAPGMKRANALIDSARALASKANRPETYALLELATGVTGYFNGNFLEARSSLEKSHALFSEHGVGTRWELDSVSIFLLGALVYQGEFKLLAERLPSTMREAQERGDLYLLTYCRIGEMNACWLAADDVASAREAIDQTMKSWSHRSFQIQHWDELRARCQCDLYDGDGRGAFDRFRARWPSLQASLLLRVQLVKGLALHLRSRCILAAATVDPEAKRALVTVERDVRRLHRERMPWSIALANLLGAALADQRGDADSAVTALDRAVEQFDALGMQLYAACARRRLAALVKGDRGRTLLAESDRYMTAQGVRAPDKASRMIAPGFVER